MLIMVLHLGNLLQPMKGPFLPCLTTSSPALHLWHFTPVGSAGGFGGSGYNYKIWYWDPDVIYDITAMRTADSTDGLDWVNDQALTQSITMPLVTGTWPDWNRGTYGPADVLYNPSATNSGTNPFD